LSEKAGHHNVAAAAAAAAADKSLARSSHRDENGAGDKVLLN